MVSVVVRARALLRAALRLRCNDRVADHDDERYSPISTVRELTDGPRKGDVVLVEPHPETLGRFFKLFLLGIIRRLVDVLAKPIMTRLVVGLAFEEAFHRVVEELVVEGDSCGAGQCRRHGNSFGGGRNCRLILFLALNFISVKFPCEIAISLVASPHFINSFEERNMTENTAIDAMFNVGAHFGYSRARRHASTKPFLYGAKNGVDIIDLTETTKMLDAAKARMMELGKLGKVVVFVGTKQEVKSLVEATAKSLNLPFVAERWVGGILTNWPEIRKRTSRLKELSDKFAKGELEKYTKMERLLFEREMAKLHTEFGGIAALEGVPAALVIVDPNEEHIAVKEATKMKAEIIALMNTDCNKNEVTYPILANDSALESVKYFLAELAAAYEEGKKQKI